jgi:hypothetical protein
MATLFIRAPFAAGAAAAASVFTIVEDAVGRITVTIDGTDPTRLALQPVFPGRLTFKPTAALAPTAPIVGNLYLEIAPAASLELTKLLTDLPYSFLVVYENVVLSAAFFDGTVKNTPIAGVQPGTATTTYDQRKDAFKRGLLSLMIVPTKSSAGCVLPVVQKDAANQFKTSLTFGVRIAENPFASPADLSLLSVQPANVVAAASFLPLPFSYFFAALRDLAAATWTAASATGHKTHPFYDALDKLDQPGGAGTPITRWRRLRVFTAPKEDTKAPPGSFSAAMADLTLRARAGANLLWEQPVNVLGELFLRRPDSEAFTLDMSQLPAATYPPTPPPAPPAAPPAPVVRQLAPYPAGAMANTLARTWAAPAAGRLVAPTVEIRAAVVFDGDPLLDPLIALEEGMEDFRGLTVVRPVKGTTGRAVARRHLIVPLQRRLASFGFGTTKVPPTKFGSEVRHAVREFQREAQMMDRTAGGVAVPAASIVPFPGAITAKADVPTLTEMRVWADAGHRAALVFEIRQGGVVVPDVGIADASTIGWKIRTPPATPVGNATRFSYQGVTYYGMVNVTADAGLLWGRRPHLEMSDPARTASYAFLTTWEKRVVLAVVHNESQIFEAVNTYDNAFMTAGAIQWTMGTGSSRGELPGILSTLLPADFQRLFGKWGLGTTDVVGRPFLDVISGRFTLDGKTLVKPAEKNELRAFRWGHRFAEAAKVPVYREVQMRQGKTRMGEILRHKLRWGKDKFTAESLLQSEMLRALVMDEHVNSGKIKFLQLLVDVLRTPETLIGIEADGVFNGEWFETLRYPKLQAAFRAKAAATGIALKKVALTRDDFKAVDATMFNVIGELLLLRLQCENPAAVPADLTEVIDGLGLTATAALVTPVHTASLSVSAGVLSAMDIDQYGILLLLYLFWRRNLSRMNKPVERWDNIMNGGYAGAFGDPISAPGVLTP